MTQNEALEARLSKLEDDAHSMSGAEMFTAMRTLIRSLTRPDAPRQDIVPGLMHCAKCNFSLTRRTLYVQSGNVGSGTSETEPCPNGCGPLWPYTWKQLCNDYEERLMKELDEKAAHPHPGDVGALLEKVPQGYICKLWPPSKISKVWDCVLKPESLNTDDVRPVFSSTGPTPAAAIQAALKEGQTK